MRAVDRRAPANFSDSLMASLPRHAGARQRRGSFALAAACGGIALALLWLPRHYSLRIGREARSDLAQPTAVHRTPEDRSRIGARFAAKTPTELAYFGAAETGSIRSHVGTPPQRPAAVPSISQASASKGPNSNGARTDLQLRDAFLRTSDQAVVLPRAVDGDRPKPVRVVATMEDGAEIVGFRVPVEARSWYLAASDGEFAGNSPEKDREVRELW